ncbi:MAG: hypothetical protein H0V19_07855 [Euzebyales bacterium]|nr:hypothetical protein [Euzebyales bacterium]
MRPQTPLVSGEGAISLAPNGDVVGVEWDPYSGDHLLAFKFDAATQRWSYSELPLHTPFYNREWIAVIPGPFTIDGRQVPYISFIKGGYPSKELWLYSTDGLTYTEASSKVVDETFTGSTEQALPPVADPSFDWIQPNTNGELVPLGAGAALAAPDYPFLDDTWSLFDGERLRWTGYRFPGGVEPQGRFQVDSAGRLQAVAIHAHDDGRATDRDLLYKLDIGGDRARVTRLQEVGHGDLDGSSGVGASVRFDFETVAILPDGRVAMSFYDSTTDARPALAIEGTTTRQRNR